MERMGALVAVWLVWMTLAPPAAAQTPEAEVAAALASLEYRQNVRSATQILRVLQNNLPVSESVRAEVGRLAAEANALQNAGKSGEALRRLHHAIALERGLPWDERAEFAASLVLRSNTVVVDPARACLLQLGQSYPADGTAARDLRLSVALCERGTGGKVVRQAGSHEILSRDLIEEPFAFSVSLEGLPDGVYRVSAELSDGSSTVLRRMSANVQVVQGIDDNLAAVRRRLASIQGHESAKASIMYPFDYARVINEGRRELIAEATANNDYYDFPAEIRNSLSLLRALESGKDPLFGSVGEHARHYYFAEAGEIMPYRVYVPSRYDGKSRLPMVVVLHGGGADQDTYFKRRGEILVKEAEKHGFIVVTPLGFRPTGGWGRTAPPAGTGAPVDRGRLRTAELSEKDALNVIELVASEYDVDRTRMYLMGNSMGGGGTWHLGAKYAERWAAIAPAASPSVSEGFPVERLKGMPILYTHGDQDATVPVEGARKMMQWLKQQGFDIPYAEIKGGTHDWAVWQNLPQIFDFFEKHRRR